MLGKKYSYRINYEKKNSHRWSVFIASSVVNFATLVNGFGLGYPSPIAVSIQNKGLLDETTFPVFASIFLFTSILGPVINYPLMKLFGRKTLILLSTIPSVMGWILIIVGTSAGWLIIGRGLSGIGSGMIWAIVPVYVGEIAEAKSRGFTLSSVIFYLCIGIALSYGAGILLPYTWLAAIPIGILLVMSVGLIFLPYSPVWLGERGCKDTALNTLRYLRGNSYDIEEEYSAIKEAAEARRSKHRGSITIGEKLAYFRQPQSIRVISIAILIAMLYQFSGITLITAYLSVFLKNIQILTPNIAAFLIVLIELLACSLSSIFTDRVGRKCLICLSLVMITLSHLALVIYFILLKYTYPECTLEDSQMLNYCNYTTSTLNGNVTSSEPGYLIADKDSCRYISIIPIISIIIFNASFSFGLGNVSFIYIGELFPIRIKSIGANLTTMVNRITGGVLVLVFPFYASFAGTYVAFLTLAIIIIISIPVVILFVPETRHKTIAETENLFKNKCINLT